MSVDYCDSGGEGRAFTRGEGRKIREIRVENEQKRGEMRESERKERERKRGEKREGREERERERE